MRHDLEDFRGIARLRWVRSCDYTYGGIRGFGRAANEVSGVAGEFRAGRQVIGPPARFDCFSRGFQFLLFHPDRVGEATKWQAALAYRYIVIIGC